MPVVGSTALRNNLRRFRDDIKDKKTAQAITAVMQVGMANAVRHAPIEYSVLVNSRFQDLKRGGYGWYGEAGFNVSYAVYLEKNENWSPRAPEDKAGPAWNPNAKPHFTRDGFESPSAKRQIGKTLEAVYKV